MLRFGAGEVPLPKAFWGYFVGGYVGIYLCLSALAEFGFRTQSRFIFLILSNVFPSFLFMAYCVLAAVGTWQSANRYKGSRIWAFVAKIFVILSLILIPVLLAYSDWSWMGFPS